MTAPCKDCQDRHEGCHGECERYKAYAAEREAINAKKREAASADGYLFAKIKKLNRTKRKRRDE